jgi:sugar phosphate isomerase/epimerase
MLLDKLKIAAYLDEAGEDILSACSVLAEHKFNYVVLRHAWSGNILDVNDQTCAKLRKTLQDHNLSVVALVTDLGKVETPQLMRTPKEKIERLFNLATYFQASMVRVHCGVKSRNQDEKAIESWMQMITEKCLISTTIPLYEVVDESVYREPPEVAKLLSANRRWKLLYDPVQLIIKQNQNPFLRYWTLLKAFIAAVDLRDFKIGHGYKPVGLGDARMKLTVDEGLGGTYKGWYFFEPSLGRRYASAVTKADTFKLALGALENIMA